MSTDTAKFVNVCCTHNEMQHRVYVRGLFHPVEMHYCPGASEVRNYVACRTSNGCAWGTLTGRGRVGVVFGWRVQRQRRALGGEHAQGKGSVVRRGAVLP